MNYQKKKNSNSIMSIVHYKYWSYHKSTYIHLLNNVFFFFPPKKKSRAKTNDFIFYNIELKNIKIQELASLSTHQSLA